MLIYALVTRTEVSKKYRGAAHASALISGVATLGYLALIAFWLVGFKLRGESWVPNPAHYFSNGFRYTDWTITVPLLTAELPEPWVTPAPWEAVASTTARVRVSSSTAKSNASPATRRAGSRCPAR